MNMITGDMIAKAIEPHAVRLAKHRQDMMREFFKRRLKHIADDCEKAQDYCRELIRSGADVSEELKEMESVGYSLALVAMLLKREASNG